ncbi:MAG: OsmC family protein [Bacteroidales bacterium]|nr:OsmC family protein [Bacteroidales bacterium]
MSTVSSKYLGDLRTECTHLQSGTKLITDAPTDNQGKGEYFSPTDLVATALGSCMVTIMGISARQYGFDLEGLTWKVTKIMADNPRRIGEIVVELDFHGNEYPDQHKRVIEHITRTCPVALSLHPELKQRIKIIW